MVALTRFLLFCAVVLALPAIADAQPPPPPPPGPPPPIAPPHLEPGWYKNSGPAIIHDDSE